MKKLLDSYILSHDLTPGSQQQLEITVSGYGKFLGREPELSDLNDDSVNRWLKHLSDDKRLSKATVRGKRVNLLTLWRYACECELVLSPPRRVRKIRPPESTPVAWTIEEIASLLRFCKMQKGFFPASRVPRAAFWRAFVMASYDTGLRLGDMLAIRTEQLSEGGYFHLTVHKTGRMITRRFRAVTVDAIKDTYPPDREFIFGGVLERTWLIRRFSAMCRGAKLRRVGSKYLRKTSATWLETIHPGGAMNHLGHNSPEIARKHYVDPRIVRRELPLPPAIPEI